MRAAYLGAMTLRLSVAWVMLAFLAPVTPAQGRGHLDTAQVRQWREDLGVLRTEMPARHADLFHAMSRAQFDSALDAIDAKLPGLERHQVIVELERLGAMIGDGHSSLSPWRDSLVAFHSLPVSLYIFSEGLIIRSADSAHSSLVGSRVLRIGVMSEDSAMAAVRPLISHDNEMGILAATPFLLAMPEVLHATGISDTPDSVVLVMEREGHRHRAVLRSSSLFPMLTGDIDRSWRVRDGWTDAREASPTPLWLAGPLALLESAPR